MTIEQEIFSDFLIIEEKLEDYGFQRDGGRLIYEKLLPEEDFKIFLEYDGEIRGRIVDLAAQEEYTNFRIRNAAGFSAEVKQKFADLLLDIREKCCRNQYYPAFHMNKKCWVSVILDNILADGEICKLIDDSYASV